MTAALSLLAPVIFAVFAIQMERFESYCTKKPQEVKVDA
ncbi:hypothetical protein CCANI_00800 [Corynebacterium canis]|nr:hypothetical protein CCANI_00800 [Corynebacterium canis]